MQMKKYNVHPDKIEVRRVYRKAKETDIEKFQEAKAKEQETMIKARQIAESLNLNMKLEMSNFRVMATKLFSIILLMSVLTSVS